jgi:metallo-beta-lactamase class B
MVSLRSERILAKADAELQVPVRRGPPARSADPAVGIPSSLVNALLALLLLAGGAPPAPPTTPCQLCAAFNETQEPFRIFGNAYYVGVHGLSSLLLTSSEGHVLVDGDLPESAAKIAASIRAVGFRVEDVKLILASHTHFDHVGGIAELARLSGARVLASKRAAETLRQGKSGPDDPQYGTLFRFPPWPRTGTFADGEVLRVGPLAVTAHETPGHTPGGASYSFSPCETSRCLNMVYADSLNPVSAPGFQFTHSAKYPDAVADFERSFATLSTLPCDILVSAHPDASAFWEKHEKHDFVDPGACRKYVEDARERLRKRIAEERSH